MNRDDYILRLLSKPSKKKWEHYAINRIYHRLNDPDIELVHQQCIRKDHQQYYLVDLYFPQLGVYLEINEGHHQHEKVKENDAKRRFYIEKSARLEQYDIDVSNLTLDEFNTKIDDFIKFITDKKQNSTNFKAWDYENRFKASLHIEAGQIEIGPYSAFRTQKDALECFGYNGGDYQKGAWPIPEEHAKSMGLEESHIVWFPRLYNHTDWENSLSADGKIIIERKIKGKRATNKAVNEKRIVFARSRDEFNRTLYKFVGVFEVEKEGAITHRFRRISTKINTYSNT